MALFRCQTVRRPLTRSVGGWVAGVVELVRGRRRVEGDRDVGERSGEVGTEGFVVGQEEVRCKEIPDTRPDFFDRAPAVASCACGGNTFRFRHGDHLAGPYCCCGLVTSTPDLHLPHPPLCPSLIQTPLPSLPMCSQRCTRRHTGHAPASPRSWSSCLLWSATSP